MQAACTAPSRRLPVVCRAAALAPGAVADGVQSECEDCGGVPAPSHGPPEETAVCTALLAPAPQQESSCCCCCQLWKSSSLADNTGLCVGGSGAHAAVYVCGIVTVMLSAAPLMLI